MAGNNYGGGPFPAPELGGGRAGAAQAITLTRRPSSCPWCSAALVASSFYDELQGEFTGPRAGWHPKAKGGVQQRSAQAIETASDGDPQQCSLPAAAP